jgi:TolA-binding protein
VRLARALNIPPETMLARAGRGATPSTAQAGTQADDAGAAARIRELEERVAQQERELAELRQLLQRQARREDVS